MGVKPWHSTSTARRATTRSSRPSRSRDSTPNRSPRKWRASSTRRSIGATSSEPSRRRSVKKTPTPPRKCFSTPSTAARAASFRFESEFCNLFKSRGNKSEKILSCLDEKETGYFAAHSSAAGRRSPAAFFAPVSKRYFLGYRNRVRGNLTRVKSAFEI